MQCQRRSVAYCYYCLHSLPRGRCHICSAVFPAGSNLSLADRDWSCHPRLTFDSVRLWSTVWTREAEGYARHVASFPRHGGEVDVQSHGENRHLEAGGACYRFRVIAGWMGSL